MHCFEVGETVSVGLRFTDEPVPRIPTPPGCKPIIVDDRTLETVIDTRVALKNYGLAGEYTVPLEYALIRVDEAAIRLKGIQKSHSRDKLALVHLYTAAGVGGKVRLLSPTFSEDIVRDRVKQRYNPFPSLGVEPLCDEAMVQAVNEGVDQLDVFVIMQQGAHIRIHRTGHLEGAKAWFMVRWFGGDELVAQRQGDERPGVAPPVLAAAVA